jgi:phage shock protein PspC (stress-responsive transcriptional regulator)
MNGGRLYRIEQDKMLFGVSDGRADYFDIDVSLVRLGWVRRRRWWCWRSMSRTSC